MVKAFAEYSMYDYLKSHDEKMESHIDNESDDYLLNVDERAYAEFLADEFSIAPMQINFDGIFVSHKKEMVSTNQFPSNGFFGDSSESYERQVITFHLPYSGNGWDLIRYRPDTYIMWTTEVFLEDNCICFEVINFYDNADSVKRESDEIIRNLKTQSDNQITQIIHYNSQLLSKIQQQITHRKDTLLKQNESLHSLGYPVKEQIDTAKTFSIPLSKKRNKIKPVIQKVTQQLDPTLDNSSYFEILDIINEAGKMIEKYPSSHVNNDEEQLRDSFLVTLKPYCEVSVTGETFNKKGKTDILLNYQNNNIFVAECKIWHGKKEYFDAIHQLLSYLTWRDSKTALIIFVKNKELTSILQTIETETSSHPNFVKFENKQDASWFNYVFHFEDDSKRQLKLAVLLYHLPK